LDEIERLRNHNSRLHQDVASLKVQLNAMLSYWPQTHPLPFPQIPSYHNRNSSLDFLDAPPMMTQLSMDSNSSGSSSMTDHDLTIMTGAMPDYTSSNRLLLGSAHEIFAAEDPRRDYTLQDLHR